jgi:hypothetical protein
VPGIHGMDSEKGFLDLWLSRMTARVSGPAFTSVATPHSDHARKSLYARGGLGGPRERPCRPTPAPVLAFDGSSATPSLLRPHTRSRRAERMAPTRTLLTAWSNGLDSSLINGLQILPAWQAYFHNPDGKILGLLNASQWIGSLYVCSLTIPCRSHGDRIPQGCKHDHLLS